MMKTFYAFLYSSITLVISACIFVAYLSINRLGESGHSDFSKMLEGTAFRPAVYRLLVPTLAKAGASFVPSEVMDLFNNLPQGMIIKQTFDKLSNEKYSGEAISALLLIYASMVGFILVEKAFLTELGYSAKEQLILPIALAILILPFSIHFAYVYDLPQIFLFAVCILSLYRRSWIVYLIFLTISLLNKETSFFLIIIFSIYYFQKLSGRDFLLLLSAQIGIFLIVRTVITHIFRNNPGFTIFWSIKYHIDQYASYPSTFIVTLLFFGSIAFLMLKDWQRKPVFLRYASSVFPLTLVLFFFAGMPMEFRIFLDILPVFGIMLFPHQKTPEVLEREITPVL